MFMHLPRFVALIAVLGALALSGCASTRPVKYQDLSSAKDMEASPPDADKRTPFSYRDREVVWKKYSSFILDPITIYSNSDGQFGDLSDVDKTILASYMQDQFQATLAKQFRPAPSSERDTLRLRVTLTGAETSTRVISTVAKIIPIGAVVNTAIWALGKQAPFIGSATYAVEIYDGASGALLDAFITKQYPGAMNIPASFGSLGAAKAGIRLGAEQLTTTLTKYGVVGRDESSIITSHP